MKPEHLIPPLCSGCQQPAHLASRVRRIHRGDRILAVDGWSWECGQDCVDPLTGQTPYRFADPPLLAWEQEQIEAAWQARFEEPLPPSERGRHPGPRRSVRVPLMLTPAEAARLDELRGELTRSEFLRRAILAAR